MNNRIYLTIFLSFLSLSLFAGSKIMLTCSEPDAEIYVNGQKLGTGSVEIKVLKDNCSTIKVVKTGFLTVQQQFCNGKGYVLPKAHHFELQTDDAYHSSSQTDLANVWIELKVNSEKTEIQAWQLISQIVTDYFDVIEVTDRETGYLRTSWAAMSFIQNTIRSRIIVKLGNTTPLVYKVKLVSEASNQANTSVKDDQNFREWDRVLRKFEDVVEQLQNRLSK